jgi:hypothetical protein
MACITADRRKVAAERDELEQIVDFTREALQQEGFENIAQALKELAFKRAKPTGAKEQRTLTLPNGTEVRAGDVLASPNKKVAAQITAVGDELAIGWLWEWSIYERRFIRGYQEMAITRLTIEELRPWSEVYPDKPVPHERK